MHSDTSLDAHAGWKMIPTVDSLELDWQLLNGIWQHCFLIVNITVPSKAIDVDHTPLARCSSEGFFVAGDGVGFTFGQWPSDIVWVGLFSKLCNILDRLWRSETGSSMTLKSLPTANGCSAKSEPLKVLTREVRVAEVRRLMWHVIAKILPDYLPQANHSCQHQLSNQR